MKRSKLSTLAALAIVASMSLTACGQQAASADNSSASETSVSESVSVSVSESAAAGDEAGFEEYPIFEDVELGFMNVSAVYFQSVPMENETISYSAEDYDIHIEADISALENNLGYGVGDWVPYLTVDYSITDTAGAEVVGGTFMAMAASDGPHYGANIKLDPGTYNVTFTIHSPGENGYLIHSDAETGPGGLLTEAFKDGNLVYTFEGWDFQGLE